MPHLVIVALLLALHLPTPGQAALACKIIPNRIGQPVCHCRTYRRGSTWQVYPMAVCQIVNR